MNAKKLKLYACSPEGLTLDELAKKLGVREVEECRINHGSKRKPPGGILSCWAVISMGNGKTTAGQFSPKLPP